MKYNPERIIQRLVQFIWFPVTSVIIFLFSAFIIYADAEKTKNRNYSEHYELQRQCAQKLVDMEISKITALTDSVRGFLETSDTLTEDRFKKFINNSDTLNNSGMFSSAWTYMAEIRDAEKHQDNFSFKKRFETVFTIKTRQDHKPNALSRVSRIHSDHGSIKLMNKAAESGKMVSGEFFPDRKNDQQTSEGENVSLDLFIPVYSRDSNGNTQYFKGILHTSININAVLDSVFSSKNNQDIRFYKVSCKEAEKEESDSRISSGLNSTSSTEYDRYAIETCLAGKKIKVSFSLPEDDIYNHERPDVFSGKTVTVLSISSILFVTLFIFNIRDIISQIKKDRESEYLHVSETIKTGNLLRSIIDSIPQCICWKDSGLNYLGCNAAFARAGGLNSSDNIRISDKNKISLFNSDLNYDHEEKRIILSGEPELNSMIEIRSGEGIEKWICVSRIPLVSEDGKISGILCIYDDRTPLLQSEKNLSLTRKLLEAAFDQNPAGMIMITSDNMTIQLINSAALLFFGIDDEHPENYKGRKYPDEINPTWKELGEINHYPLARTLKGEKITNEEYRIIRKNGDNAWGIINGTPVYDKGGSIIAGLVIFTDITERKNMEDALKINEEKYRALFEQSNAGVFLYNHDYVIIDCNEQFAITIGSPKEKLIGLELEKLRDQKVLPAIKKAMTGEIVSFEGDYDTTTSGISIRVSFVALPIRNSADEIICGCAVVENITEKWLIQKALIEKSDELDKFFTNSLDLLCIAGTDSRFKRLNPQWEDTLGYSVSELVGKSFWDFVHPDDVNSTKTGLAPLNISKAVVDFENRYRCRNGSYKWIEWRAFHSGDTIYAAARDITSRKQAEDEIRSREELFRTLSDMAPIGIFLADEKGDMILVNRKLMDVSGISSEESIGKGWISLVHPEDIARVDKIWSRSVRQEDAAETECRFVRPDGKIKNILVKATPFIRTGNNLNGFVGIMEDITERKRIETEREHLLSELSHKNSELEGIVYAASHDLRSPLVNIQGFSMRIEKLTDELASLVKKGENNQETLNIIEKKLPSASNYIKISAAKMDGLIKGLLQVARIGRRPLVTEKTDMNIMIRNILHSMAFQIQEAGAEVVCGNLPECEADINQLNQAFSNLVDNALKYATPERKPVITIYGYTENGKSVYVVGDNGCGISHEHKEKIWGLFYRASHSSKVSGEGLGLTMVKKIIERHGGKIWMESDSSGTKFFIELRS